MDDEQRLGEPFAIPDLWRDPFTVNSPWSAFAYPATTDLDSSQWPLKADILSESQLNVSTLPSLKIPVLRFPNLEDFSFEPLEDVGSLQSSSASLSDVTPERNDTVEGDIWTTSEVWPAEKERRRVRCWEDFFEEDLTPPQISYVIESGPETFDALLSSISTSCTKDSQQPPVRVLRRDAVLAGLLQLSLGNESVLYRYDSQTQSIQARFDHMRPSGYSMEVFSSLESNLIEHANRLRLVRSFIENILASRKPSRSLVSIAGCVRAILTALDVALNQVAQSVNTLLQLQALLQGPFRVLAFLQGLIKSIPTAASEEQVLSLLYKSVMTFEGWHWMRLMVFGMLSKVARPWLESVGDWLGLSLEPGRPNRVTRVAFIQAVEDVDNQSKQDQSDILFQMDEGGIPEYMDVEDATRIFETGRSLQMLQRHKPRHPLVLASVATQKHSVPLDLRPSWDHIERIRLQAEKHRANLLDAIREFDSCSGDAYEKPNLEEEEIQHDSTANSQQRAQASMFSLNAQIERPLPELITDGDDNFLRAITASLSAGEQSPDETSSSYPPLSLVPSLCFNPIIDAQAGLINQSCLQMLFKDFKLRSHLSLQYRYSLLGDGVFSSRLSHALFDPDLPSAERRKGNPRLGISGLKLGFRETWPPASSELRLALIGILSDSYHAASSTSAHAELPGGLSFAIRPLSEEELQKCMDPNSIFALDFLRLQYKPPAPLDALITQSALDKYDSIFRLLILMTRLLHAVKGISRENGSKNATGDRGSVAQRFSIEAFHFVSSVSSYFFEAIHESWFAFERRVDELEKRTQRYELGEHDGIDGFREMHEGMLNNMMLALFLRRRHESVMALLQEVFALVLDFSRGIRMKGTSDFEELRGLYRKWSKKVKVFVSVCRGLSERKGSKDGPRVGEPPQGNIERLLLKLDIGGYYTRRINS
ncbi:MAG: hypothetical protein Q9191_003887 [Dirinaria sp. TL-2023a]